MNDIPAFPLPNMNTGMALRDYFATEAMQAMIKYGPWSDYVDMEQIARLAYQQADAMMKASVAETWSAVIKATYQHLIDEAAKAEREEIDKLFDTDLGCCYDAMGQEALNQMRAAIKARGETT
jgi:hypothetical protein